MNSLEPKKLAIIRILQILYKHSDADHPLTQDEIATYLLNDYGIELERKAIGKNIAILRDYFCGDNALPYMFTDKPEHVEFLCDGWVLDHAVDWFGDNARISRQGERYKVSVRVSPMAMEYWAMQYLNAVEITFPQSLRQKIAANLHAAMEKYN